MSPCISWNSLGFLSHPSPSQMLCSPRVTWSGNFIICLGTMPHFQEGLKTESVDKNKVQEGSRGAYFPTSWKKKNLGIFFFPLPSLQGLLFSVRLKLYVLHCILSGRMPQV